MPVFMLKRSFFSLYNETNLVISVKHNSKYNAFLKEIRKKSIHFKTSHSFQIKKIIKKNG